MVSVIITTHNRVHMVGNAVSSVKNQTYKNIEILVVDDASSDGTEELCSRIKGIRYIRIPKEESRGGNYARNLGIRNARGRYIAFLDDDDMWHPDKVRLQLNKFQECPECGMVYTGRYMMTGNRLFDYQLVMSRDASGNLSKKDIFSSIRATLSTIMVKREILDKAGDFDENLKCWQDFEFIIRIRMNCSIEVIPDSLVWYRKEINDRNRLTNNYADWKEAAAYIQKKYRREFLKMDSAEKKHWKEMCLNEAAYRIVYTGNKKRMRKYYFQLYHLTGRPDYLVRCIFGLSRQDTVYLECIVNKIKFYIYRRSNFEKQR